jgi:RNA ligase (TIGR02306 family)
MLQNKLKRDIIRQNNLTGVSMSERKLATIRKIEEINPIPDADAIECAIVGGWKVVVKKNDFKVGDLAIYCEIDSFISNSIAPYLTKEGHEPKEYEGIKGERLRTIRLRKTLSQGLLLPVDQFDGTRCFLPQVQVELGDFTMGPKMVYEGDDVTEVLGIKKWERPMDAQLAGMARGNFPSNFPKTDAERVQNLRNDLQKWIDEEVKFEVSMKLDGSSMSGAKLDDVVHVCSRNLSLKLDQEGNTFIDTAKKIGLIDLLTNFEQEIAIQGELLGTGIQNNQEKINGHEFFVFEIFKIKEGKYMTATERREFCKANGLKHVPVLHESITLKELGINSIADALEYAEGPSMNPSAKREGVVFKNEDGSIKFKSISNSWLMKNE